MTALRADGPTQVAIAKRMGMSEKAVRNWLKRSATPTWKRQFRRRSVLERWQEGVHEAKQLYEEIRAQGFPGSVRIVQRFVQVLADGPKASMLSPTSTAEHFSANKSTWLFTRDPNDLMTEKQTELALICQRNALLLARH